MGIFFRGSFFLRIVEKTAKIAKIRIRKNLVPHGNISFVLANSRHLQN